MKILFLTNKVPWPLKDGGAIGTFNLAYAMAKEGCHVEMLSINTTKHPINPDDIPQIIQNRLKIETLSVDTSIKAGAMLKNLMLSDKPYIAERFNSPVFAEKLKEKLQKNTYDIVILEILYMGTYIPVIRRHSDAHISFHAPNIEHEIWLRISANTSGLLKRLYLKNMAKRIQKFENKLLNKYDSLIPVSETNASTYKAMGVQVPVHVAKIGLFFDKLDEKQISAESDKELSLGHIGALDWMPNIEGLMWFLDNVWPHIYKKQPEVRFRIAGRNAASDIKSQLDRPGVEYLGEVPDAYDFTSSQTVMVVPLLSGSGMRVKIIESLGLGKAIVSTTKGAEGIQLTSGKHLIIKDSPEDFAEACLQLLNQPEKRKTLENEGRNLVRKQYDNQKIAAKLISFYQTILK
jgi:glycosyltransferase involved in cell wall biosynthesis